MTRLWTLSPSWPANGPSLMRNVIDSVGGSTGWAGSGSSTDGSQSVSATFARLMPASAMMSPAPADSTGVRSRPWKARTFCTRKFSSTLAFAVERFQGLVRLDGARRDAAGQNAAEERIGVERGREHAERAVIDGRRRHVLKDQIEHRRQIFLRDPKDRAPSSRCGLTRRGRENRAARRSRRGWRRGRRLRSARRCGVRPAGRSC